MERIKSHARTRCILIFVLACNFLFCAGISWTKYEFGSYFNGHRCVPNETIFERFNVYDMLTCSKICYMTSQCLSYLYQPDTQQCIGCRVYGAIWTDHYDDLPGSIYLGSTCYQKYKRVGVYSSIHQYLSGDDKHTPDMIDAKLCTHVIYVVRDMSTSNREIVDKPSTDHETMFKKLQSLKVSNPCLKTLFHAVIDTTLIESRNNSLEFIQLAVSFLRTYGFDGLELRRSGDSDIMPANEQNLVRLVEEMKQTFVVFGYLLALNVPARKESIDGKYDVKQMVENLDSIHVRTFGFLDTTTTTTTGLYSPLYQSRQALNNGEQLNMNWAAEYWISKGVPKEKLIIGISTFALTFTLASEEENMVGAPAVGLIELPTYSQICLMLENRLGIERWDDEQKSPYYIDGKFWASYDNVRSISEKMYWLKEKGYGGVFVSYLSGDDFRPKCKSSSRSYPLLSVINDLLTSG